MKTISSFLIFLLLLSLSTGCTNTSNKRRTSKENNNDTISGADSMVQSYSGSRLVKEIPYKNGVRQGLMKTYNANGQLYQTFWYEKGKIQDTAILYFPDGKIFRKTPFKNDSANGIQTQYYASGRVRAKLIFVNGLRTPYLEEFESDGTKVKDYTDLIITTKDEYGQNGSFKIFLEVSKKNTKANFYRGEYVDGLFNPKKCTKINATETTGYLELKKSGNPGSDHVGIIAEILTPHGNRNLVYKKINLPHNDLK